MKIVTCLWLVDYLLLALMKQPAMLQSVEQSGPPCKKKSSTASDQQLGTETSSPTALEEMNPAHNHVSKLGYSFFPSWAFR